MQSYDATAWTIPGCPVFSRKVVHRSEFLFEFAELRRSSRFTFAGQPGKLSVPAGTTRVLLARSVPRGCDRIRKPPWAPRPSPQPWWYGYTWLAQNEGEQTGHRCSSEWKNGWPYAPARHSTWRRGCRALARLSLSRRPGILCFHWGPSLCCLPGLQGKNPVCVGRGQLGQQFESKCVQI